MHLVRLSPDDLKHNDDNPALKFASLCPFIVPSVKQSTFCYGEVVLKNSQNGSLFPYLLYAINYLNEDGHNNGTIDCVCINALCDSYSFAWAEVEWSHYILRHLFATKNLLFGKFSSSFFPDVLGLEPTCLFVIRRFNEERDTIFVDGVNKARRKKTPLIEEFRSLGTLGGDCVLSLTDDKEKGAQMFRRLKTELTSGAYD